MKHRCKRTRAQVQPAWLNTGRLAHVEVSTWRGCHTLAFRLFRSWGVARKMTQADTVDKDLPILGFRIHV